MSGILSVIKVSDVPQVIAEKYTATGTIGEVVQREVGDGQYIQISFPLDGVDKNGIERRVTARYNVKPEWFVAGFEKSEEYEGYTDGQKTNYQINMKKKTRNLFAGAGLSEMDFSQLEGNQVGFSVGPESRDTSRQEVKDFHAPRK